jgi:hypothetical protein
MNISCPAEGEAAHSLPEEKGIKILPNELSTLPQMDTFSVNLTNPLLQM